MLFLAMILNYCFLMSSKICKEYIYRILNIASNVILCHQNMASAVNFSINFSNLLIIFSKISFIRMIDVAGFVNQPLFNLISVFCSCSALTCRYIKIHSPKPPQPQRVKANLYCKNIQSKRKAKSNTSSYYRENQILSRLENSLLFLQTVTISFM